MTSDSKPLAPPADGFFSRWSRRKDAERQGASLAEPLAPPPGMQPGAADPGLTDPDRVDAVVDPADRSSDPEPAKPLSLIDAQALGVESDFMPFMARGVAPEVRNAAMKKLFADPHYNVMDGLDIYIDDYSKSVPLPAAVVKQLVSAQFLGLFDEDPQPAVPLDRQATTSVTAATATTASPTATESPVAGAYEPNPADGTQVRSSDTLASDDTKS